MGCDIHPFAEVKNKETNEWNVVTNHFSLSDFEKNYYNKEKGDAPFDWRDYNMFAFLAGVRSDGYCEPLAEQRGLPPDANIEIKDMIEKYGESAHSASYLTLRELVEFDYKKIFWDKRVTNKIISDLLPGIVIDERDKCEIVTYNEYLGDFFFKHLDELTELGEPDDVRIVFWFDN